MKFAVLKSMAIMMILLFSFPFQGVYSQSKKPSRNITPAMALKIGYYCQYNQRALSLFAMANPEQVQNRSDRTSRLLSELDKHLDCAENFILTLYYNYGVEMSYFALKDAGFTIQETDKAELIWRKKEQEKRAKSEKGRNEAEERRRAEAEKLSSQNNSEKDIVSENISKTTDDEEIVDLNDYIGTPDDGTDWNHVGFEDEKEAKEFEELLKSKGIYWSNSKNAWVKRKERQAVSSGAGANNLSYNVAGRSAKSLPRPMFNSEFEEGIVVIDIEVTPEGKVTNAKISNKTTVSSNSVKQSCLNAALQTVFSKSNLSENQSGSISYHCIVK